ncbi:MAG: TonB-dependent receptor [Bacteroidetes bacterium]|nr:TonB-dependent receptor [Bacteroidota bacterium]
MNNSFKGIVISIIYCLPMLLHAQDSLHYNLAELTVTASKSPVYYSDLARTVDVIQPQDIKNYPVNTIGDLLQYIGGVDLKQRGAEGVQSDISIRGGSFEQTLILIDGIKIIDPQTGHHNLNLPVDINEVERIEILKGEGSKIHGPNAFSGVINIITKKSSVDELYIKASGGNFGFHSQTLGLGNRLGSLSTRVSATRSKSDGYIHNTEFESANISVSSTYVNAADYHRIFLGFNEKDFGANSFYSSKYPDQSEHTITKLLAASSEYFLGSINVSPKIYWRRNNDEFLLKKNNPAFYKNLHETNVFGGEIGISVKSDYGSTSFGGEFGSDKIVSNNLGNHSRERHGYYLEHQFESIIGINLNVGGFAYKYSNLDWKVWPGFDAAYRISQSVKIYSSYGKAFRVPTYTELFYNDPVTAGNQFLKYEESDSYEFGSSFNSSNVSLRANIFYREGKNLIDWVKSDDSSKWNARNISEINTTGFEFRVTVNPVWLDFNLIEKIDFDFTHLSSDKFSGNLESRYLLDHLKNQAILKIMSSPLNIITMLIFRYEQRLNNKEQFLVDFGLAKAVIGVELFVKVSNLFDRKYEDIAGVMLPGRWVKLGVSYSLEY